MLIVSTAYAQDVYTYMDEDGTIHFTDQPKPGWKRVIVGPSGYKVVTDNSSYKDARFVGYVGPQTPYSKLINEAVNRYRIDGALIASVIQVESDFNPSVVSHAGAKGLMQLMDMTADSYGVTDVFDPAQNINAGAHHLRDLLNVYDGNIKIALAAYNAGRGAVAKHGGVPPYEETRHYLEKIAKLYGGFDSDISDIDLANSYVAARALASGERFIYRYRTANGVAYSEIPPKGKAYDRINLRK